MPRFDSAGTMASVVERYSEIERLQEKVKRLLSEIEEVYAQIQRVATTNSQKPARGARRSPRQGGTGKGRAKRGELKAALHKVLAGGKAMKPVEIVQALPKIGFKSASNPRVLYNTIYLTLKKDKSVLKTKEGFRIKAPRTAKK